MDDRSAIFNQLAPDYYTLTLRDLYGCTVTELINIGEVLPITVDLGPDQSILLGESVTLVPFTDFPYEELSFEWSEYQSLDLTDTLMPIATPSMTQLYTLTVTDLGGCTASDDILINVDLERKVFIPNAFTPNGDGVNDLFQIFVGGSVDVIRKFVIYDRWGELLFEATDFNPNDLSVGWDGTFKGRSLNPAVFVYYTEVEFVGGEVVGYQGDVTLIR